MNFVALKMLVGDRMKYVALVAGVAFAALLITQQAAIFVGYAMQTGAWVRDTAVADLWVMDDQVEFTDDFKPMADMELQRIRGVPGVAWAVPMYKNYLRSRLPDGTLTQTRVVGLDDATLTGGPPEMVEGRLEDLRQDRGVLVNVSQVDTTLAPRRGGAPLKVGDRISVNDNEAVVVGTYRATKEFFWDPVLYTTYSRALSWAPRERKVLTFVHVKVQPGADVAAVAGRIRATTGLAAMTNDAFEWQTMTDLLKRTGILINFGITIALGFVIGLLVAGQTFYTFVLDNLRQFAALKAMGLTNAAVLRMLCLQVVVVGSVGYGIGVGAASVFGSLVGGDALAFQMSWQIPIVGGVAVLACCLVAGMMGIVRVLRVEPAVVFK